MTETFSRATHFSASARLDIMGGVSESAGGICLSAPLEIATNCRVTPHDESHILASLNGSEFVEIAHNNEIWARCITEIFEVLRIQIGWCAPRGMKIEIHSTIPRGAGLGASVSIEVAVLSALNLAFDLGLDDAHRALLCAQPATALAILSARPHHLSQIKCQPARIENSIELPDELELWALDSGVNQSAKQADYEVAMCAMKMGAALLGEIVPAAMRGPNGELYGANLNTDIWRALRLKIPEKMSGAEFLKHHENFGNLEIERVYNVRLATEHPIYEADRAARFAQLLGAIRENPAARFELGRAAGELMIQSHFSYDHRCNLNSAETDLLVELAREIGPKRGIYGAKITGRGGGGCIALLCDRSLNADLESAIEEIRARYCA